MRAAVEVMAFVIDAMRNRVLRSIGSLASMSRQPTAAVWTTWPSRQINVARPARVPASTIAAMAVAIGSLPLIPTTPCPAARGNIIYVLNSPYIKCTGLGLTDGFDEQGWPPRRQEPSRAAQGRQARTHARKTLGGRARAHPEKRFPAHDAEGGGPARRDDQRCDLRELQKSR